MWPDLDAIKAWLGIVGTEYDEFLTQRRAATISMIERYCNRLFELQNRIEEYDLAKCTGIPIGEIFLKATPIAVINSITGISTWRETGYGSICLLLDCHSESSDGKITVDYDGGFDPIPPEIIDVFYSMINFGYTTKDAVPGNGQIKKETVMGVVSTEYVTDSSAGGAAVTQGMPDYYAAILDSYVMRKV